MSCRNAYEIEDDKLLLSAQLELAVPIVCCTNIQISKWYWLQFFHNACPCQTNRSAIYSISAAVILLLWGFLLLEKSQLDWQHYSICRLCLAEALIVCCLKSVGFFWWLLYSPEQTLNTFLTCTATWHTITAHFQKRLLHAESFSSKSDDLGSRRGRQFVEGEQGEKGWVYLLTAFRS